MANFCPRCGGGVDPNGAFCGVCGTPLTGDGYDNGGSANPYDAGAPVAENAYWAAADETPTIPGFGEAIKICLKKWTTWRGRASRSEYWWFTLFTILVNIALQAGAAAAEASGEIFMLVVGLAMIVFGVWFGVAGIAVTIRRLHDTNRSGWHFWWVLLPYVGAIILFIFEVQGSTPGPNRFGPQPIKR